MTTSIYEIVIDGILKIANSKNCKNYKIESLLKLKKELQNPNNTIQDLIDDIDFLINNLNK